MYLKANPLEIDAFIFYMEGCPRKSLKEFLKKSLVHFLEDTMYRSGVILEEIHKKMAGAIFAGISVEIFLGKLKVAGETIVLSW